MVQGGGAVPSWNQKASGPQAHAQGIVARALSKGPLDLTWKAEHTLQTLRRLRAPNLGWETGTKAKGQVTCRGLPTTLRAERGCSADYSN